VTGAEAPAIHATGLTKRYGHVDALTGLSMSVARGQSVSPRIQPPLSHRIERGGEATGSVTEPVLFLTGTIPFTTPASVRTSTSASTSKKPVRLSRLCASLAEIVTARADLS